MKKGPPERLFLAIDKDGDVVLSSYLLSKNDPPKVPPPPGCRWVPYARETSATDWWCEFWG